MRQKLAETGEVGNTGEHARRMNNVSEERRRVRGPQAEHEREV